MPTDLEALRDTTAAALAQASDLKTWDAIRVATLGKSGALTAMLKELGRAAPEERRERGAALNRLRDELAAAIEARRSALQADALTARLAAERVDITLPPRLEQPGSIHPISRTLEEITAIFGAMGFTVGRRAGHRIRLAQFLRAQHPGPSPGARRSRHLLSARHRWRRTARAAHAYKPGAGAHHAGAATADTGDRARPHLPGGPRCHAQPDVPPMRGPGDRPRHHARAPQGVPDGFPARVFFGIATLPVRFRASYFPFTEPSMEVDIGWSRRTGELGAGADWLEILGSGMVHPKVLANCGIDPRIWQGFAFGMGMERVTMLKHGMPDLRPFFESDLRWLRHYATSAFTPASLHEGVAG